MSWSLEKRPWLLAAPPAGFLLFFLYPRNRLRGALIATGLLLFTAAVVVNALAAAFMALCPFFIEPGVAVFNAALRAGLVVTWCYATWQVWLHADDPTRLAWFETIRRHPLTARLDAPFRSA